MRVLFIPLQRFRIQASLKEAIASYLTGTGRFPQSPLAQPGFASPKDPLLLIFDGLDELTKPGDLADAQTELFIAELRQNLTWWNEQAVQVLALITGRTVYAQAKRSLLRIADRQEVAVLPYLVDETRKSELCERREATGQGLLGNDQREQWWGSYAMAKGLENGSLPEVFKKNHDLRELTADPLLNYLVVLSGFHKDLDLAGDTDINRNRIYARLMKDVLDRRHAKRAQTDKVTLAAVGDAKDRDMFERLLETVALAAWYGDGRTTTRAEIEKLLPGDLEVIWQELVTGGPGFTRLIAAFYIRQTEGSATSDAVEFTHKSFGEYLTSRRLVREISDLHQELQRGGRYKEDDALGDWAKLTSGQAMTMDLLRFLRDEVALRPKYDVTSWQATLTRLFDLELRAGFPLTALPSEGFREAEQRSKNAEEALLAVVNACARVTEERVAVEWPHIISAGDMLHRLRGQRKLHEPSVALACLARLPMANQRLFSQDLGEADLSNTDLAESLLDSSDLSSANLRGASLNGAEIILAFVAEADFSEADLSEANLGMSIGDRAKFTASVLNGADLSRADFTEADLSGADLSGADLSGADLSGADLSGADLSGATLNWADLRKAQNVTEEQIQSARDITGAKLPDHLNHLEKKANPRPGRRPSRLTP